MSIYGPYICGEAIDFKNDGNLLLTGSHRQDDVIELWDIRNGKRARVIDWNGPKASQDELINLEHKGADDENEIHDSDED